MKDDEMDDMLIRGALEYNEPGAVPRDEMWSRIAAARREAAAKTAPTTATKVGSGTWIRLAIAAGALLAVGIGIGRQLERDVAPVGTVVTTPTAAPKDTVRLAATDTLIPQLREETRKTDRRVQELASTSPTATAPNAATDTDAMLAYRLVMLRHVAGSEAMITAFRTSSRRGEVDAYMARWSRDLLNTTRMLASSPLAYDPTMKRLLEDLDLILVQIGQYVTRGTVDREELDLIEQSINTRGVITKLRSSLPVRNAPAGT